MEENIRIPSLCFQDFKFYKKYDYPSNDISNVFAEGVSALFPEVKELTLKSCRFFDSEDNEPRFDPFAEELKSLETLRIINKGIDEDVNKGDIQQYCRPTVKHLVIEHTRIISDISNSDSDNEDDDEDEEQEQEQKSQHLGLATLFTGMPEIQSIRLSGVTFITSEDSSPLSCTREELEDFLILLKGLQHLQSLNIKGGNWVRDEDRKYVTHRFRQELNHLETLTLDW